MLLFDLGGVNFNTGARHALAREVALLGLHEDNLTINSCMDGEVAAHESARTGKLRSTGLTDENLASLNGLATKTLDAKSLAGVVV